MIQFPFCTLIINIKLIIREIIRKIRIICYIIFLIEKYENDVTVNMSVFFTFVTT